jgi:ABC-type branched-subunit amino acid transport system substrate-binding protein
VLGERAPVVGHPARAAWLDTRLSAAVAARELDLAWELWTAQVAGSPLDFAAYLERTLAHDEVLRAVEHEGRAGGWRGPYWLELAEERAQRGLWQGAQDALVLAGELGPPLTAKALALSQRVASELAVAPNKLGVLLPLSGARRELGQRALRALQMALDGASDVQLAVMDTGGDAQKAAAATDALLAEGAVALLGPVGTQEARAAAGAVAARELAYAPLCPRPLEPSPGPLYLRLGPTEEALALAAFAAADLGAKRAAMLVPDTAYGKELAQAFAAAFRAQGGQVVVEVSLDAHGKQAQAAAKRLVAHTSPPLDALLFPASPAVALHVLPYLQAAGLTFRRAPDSPGVQLLSGRLWAQGSVVDPLAGLTENAVFTSAWDAQGSERAAAFARAFQARFAEPPTDFEAEVYDAAMLVVGAVRAGLGPLASRSRVLRVLQQLGATEGVTGVFAFGPGGVAPRPAHLLTVHRSEIRRRASLQEERVLRGGF